MRVTRAAQRAQQDAEEPVEAVETKDRALQDIEPNATPSEQTEDSLPVKTPAKTPAKKGKGKGAKKGAKARKAKTDEEDLAQTVEEVEQHVAVDLDAEHEHMHDVAEHLDNDEQPKVPQTPATRLTRRQLAKLEEEEAQRSEGNSQDVAEQTTEQEETAAKDDINPGIQEAQTRAETQPTPKPVRRTRRQQTKAEEEEPEQKRTEETAGLIPEQAEVSVAVEDAATCQEGEALDQQDRTEVNLEPAPETKRLTRRQQAQLEKQGQQRSDEQHTAQPEPTEERVVEEIVTETQIDAAAKHEHDLPAQDAVNIDNNLASMASAEQGSSTREEADPAPQEIEADDANLETPDNERVADTGGSGVSSPEIVQLEPVEERPMTPTDAEFEADFEVNSDVQMIDACHNEASSATEDAPQTEPKMLSSEKPVIMTASTPASRRESIRRISRSSTRSPMCLEESISAIDRLEEDLESIGEAIPDLNHSEEEKSPKSFTDSTAFTSAKAKTTSKTGVQTPAKASARTPMKVASKTPNKTPAKAPILAKTSVQPKVSAAAKAAPPSRISKVPSAAPTGVKPTGTSLARASSVRAAPSKEARKPSTDTADYLASKRRPISLSFPTPPPPPKGRAPTKPTFQLSSDNVAAKLKAQKEERLRREAEGSVIPKQRPISMPPPPKSSKPPTVPSFQLPGEATAARLKAQKEERLKRMQEAGGSEKPTTRPISMPPPPKSTKQVTKPTFQLPGEATAARLKAQKEERLKRMEEAQAAKKAALTAPSRKPIAHRPRSSMLAKDAPGISIPPPPQNNGPRRATSTSSANRSSVMPAENGKCTVTPADAAASKVKGKQVFNRDKAEKEAVERERKDKEEAAKRARAEAAERGRIASREWAERQRKKMMGL
ncbi:hypothetical protein E8E13_011627 [Curvularia kusanoi]|uniref:Carboxylesterase family protein n=1 Tax=Curvularia kusanoi TaxID=90978 RepID=A0A9P4TML7_CURKU|nr:hypothetical protein E8E13_011627 [Curvularia kusanoi]